MTAEEILTLLTDRVKGMMENYEYLRNIPTENYARGRYDSLDRVLKLVLEIKGQNLGG